jgi:hypothetical protein
MTGAVESLAGARSAPLPGRAYPARNAGSLRAWALRQRAFSLYDRREAACRRKRDRPLGTIRRPALICCLEVSIAWK